MVHWQLKDVIDKSRCSLPVAVHGESHPALILVQNTTVANCARGGGGG